MRRLQTVAALGVAICLLLGCSPALNWRAVRLQGLTAMLPCKPDRAERRLTLGTQDVTLSMAGCEASGVLYAISHVQVADAALAKATQADWQESMLAHFQTPTVLHEPYQLAPATIVGRLPASSPSDNVPRPVLDILNVQGNGADGAALQARLLWVAHGVDIYHVAIYAPALKPEHFDMLFSQLALQ